MTLTPQPSGSVENYRNGDLKPRPERRPVRSGAVWIVLAAALALAPAVQVWAQGELSVTVMAGHNLVVDSNVTSPATYAPSAAYIGGEICNVGDADLEGVIAHIGDYSANTPGIFPTWDSSVSPPFAEIADTGTYSLTLEAG